MSLCEHCGSYNREHLTIRQVEALEGIRAALERAYPKDVLDTLCACGHKAGEHSFRDMLRCSTCGDCGGFYRL